MENKKMYLKKIIIVLIVFIGFKVPAQNNQDSVYTSIPINLKWSERMALSIMKRHPNAY